MGCRKVVMGYLLKGLRVSFSLFTRIELFPWLLFQVLKKNHDLSLGSAVVQLCSLGCKDLQNTPADTQDQDANGRLDFQRNSHRTCWRGGFIGGKYFGNSSGDLSPPGRKRPGAFGVWAAFFSWPCLMKAQPMLSKQRSYSHCPDSLFIYWQ